MITLHRLAPHDLGRLAGLRLRPGQRDFVGTGAEMILDPTEGISFHEIRDPGGRAVGMFKLDPLYWQRHVFATERHLGLRGLLIDADLQGHGLGGAALTALPAHVAREYPGYEAVVLTVSVLNISAYEAYLRSGLKDRGQYHVIKGKRPEHVLWLDLPISR